MLVRLDGSQIEGMWNIIDTTILESGYRVGGNFHQFLVEAVAKGNIQVWVGTKEEKLLIVTITHMVTSLEGKTLFVAALKIFNSMGRNDWIRWMDTLKIFGEGNGCYSVTGITNKEAIVKLVNFLGGRSKENFLLIPIRKE